MDESWLKWVSFLDTNDYPLFSGEYDINNSVEEELEGENSVDPAAELSSWENHSSTLLSNSPSKLLEEINNNNTGFNMTSFKQQHAISKACVLSFEDSTSVPITSTPPKKTFQYDGEQHSKEMTQEKPQNRKPLKRDRTSSLSIDHIMAERKRRENITRLFIALSALIPGLKKMDKVSVLNRAVEYVKHIQQRVQDLEQDQNKKRKTESVVACFKINKTTTTNVEDEQPMIIKKCPKVEARVSGNDVLMRVTCEKQKGIVRKLLAKLEAHNLSIVCTNVLPFGNSSLSITSIAKMDHEFSMTVDTYDLVKILTDDLLECCKLQQ